MQQRRHHVALARLGRGSHARRQGQPEGPQGGKGYDFAPAAKNPSAVAHGRFSKSRSGKTGPAPRDFELLQGR